MENGSNVGLSNILQIAAIVLAVMLAIVRAISIRSSVHSKESSKILFRSSILQIARSVDGLSIGQLGRVPLELRPRMSERPHATIYYLFRYMFAYLFLRPSSRKVAFAVQKIDARNSDGEIVGYEGLRRGGLTIELALAETEDIDHFRRSLRHRWYRRIFVSNSREIIIAEPNAFSREITTFKVIKVDTRSKCMEDDGAYTVTLVSVKKLDGPNHHLQFKDRSELPETALWLVKTDARNRSTTMQRDISWLATCRKIKQLLSGSRKLIFGSSNAMENDPSVRRGPPNDHIEFYMFRFVAVAYLALYLAVTLLIYLTLGEGCLKCDFSEYGIFGILWISLSLFSCSYIVSHIVRYICFEIGRNSWSGGTTRCIRDGDILRDGR